MNFEEKLGFWGKKKFGTYVKFAEALEISPSNLQRYLNGEQKPGYKIFLKLHEFGCDLHWLMDPDGEESEADISDIPPQTQMKIIRLEAENKRLNELFSKLGGMLGSYVSTSSGD
jgi:transcriptional regulator with XRE-family HTH domain